MTTAIVIIIFVAIAVFIWRAVRGVVRNLDYLETSISELLMRGYDCGFVAIKISYSKKFVQFRKYIRSPGDYGIQLAFPKAKWALPYFDKVEGICRSLHPSSSIIDDAGGMDFLYVDFGKNITQAHECIRKILTDVFGVTDQTKLFFTLENASVKDELIERA